MATKKIDQEAINKISLDKGVDLGVAKDMYLNEMGLNNANAAPIPPRVSQQQNTFDTQGLYDASLKAKQAQAQANLNTQINTLNKNYATNMLGYNTQKVGLERNYEKGIQDIRENTYRDIEGGKVNATQRGIMNSSMGLALGQASMRAGSEQQSYATQQRNDLLNEINAQINNLTQAYGSDVATAQTNYGLGLTQATNEALQMKLGADMDIWKQKDQQEHNKFMQDDQQNFLEMQNNLDRQQSMAIAQLSAATQIKASQISAGAQIQAANIASADRQAAQKFIEKQWETERQDAFDQNKIIAEQGFNSLMIDPNAKLKANYGFDLWGTDRTNAQNTFDAKVRNLVLDGIPEAQAKQMVTKEMSTAGYTNAQQFSNAIQNFINSLYNK